MKVDCHIGITFHLGAVSSNQFARMDIAFRDIDPELPLAAQIQSGNEVAAKAFNALLPALDARVEEMLNNDGK